MSPSFFHHSQFQLNSQIIELIPVFNLFLCRICEVVVPQLIEKNSLAGLTWILHFFVDIPDASLLKILVHCLKNPSETEQKGVVSLILQKPAVQNVRLFRSHSSFQSTVNLLSIINELLGESLGDCNILNWACLCLDAYYQQFLLIKDASTLELLKSVADAVSSEVRFCSFKRLTLVEALTLSVFMSYKHCFLQPSDRRPQENITCPYRSRSAPVCFHLCLVPKFIFQFLTMNCGCMSIGFVFYKSH